MIGSINSRVIAVIDKDPDAVLDYWIDWSDWLASGEVIDEYAWTVDGVTVVADSQDESTIFVWLSGGTPGTKKAKATCHITTNQGRQEDASLRFNIVER